MPQVHQPVGEAHLRVGFRAGVRGFGTRGQSTIVAVGSRGGRSPNGRFVSGGNRAPAGVGRRGPEIARGIDASARRSQSRSRCLILTKFRRGCKTVAGEGFKTSCRSCGVSVHQSTRCGPVVIRKTFGAPRCDRVWGQRVDSGVGGFDSARSYNLPFTVGNMVV